MHTENFSQRHIGVSKSDEIEMLNVIGVSSVDQLIDEAVPANIRLKNPLVLDAPLTEAEFLNHMRDMASKNKVFRSFIGLGYYGTLTPSVILRNIFENPGWYTAYTPYQAEIAQGRLEALLNFQTVVSDLTGMEIANASLLDEATACAEAVTMLHGLRTKEQKNGDFNTIFVDENIFPQTLEVLKTRTVPVGISIEIGDWKTASLERKSYYAAVVQYPAANGEVCDYRDFSERLKQLDIKLIVAADIMALTLLVPPGEWGADVVVGNTQRFGVPMGAGGPHAAFFATKEEYKRNIPGRIIGVSRDRTGKMALRMALQTREQHIRRDKATSNICTAQALLSVMASMYAVYHGADGLKAIATKIHDFARSFSSAIKDMGYTVENHNYFDTITVKVADKSQIENIKANLLDKGINANVFSYNKLGFSFDEATQLADLSEILEIFAQAANVKEINTTITETGFPATLARISDFLTHPTFNRYRSETDMMRYIKKLENRDLSLVHSMISLGSCTMKLNAATELMPLSWPEFAHIHPFAPTNQMQGYVEIYEKLNKDLSHITGFSAMSLQPNSGAQGEYAGLMVIRAYHEARGESHRNIAIIPSSAHGTNPASAVMAGMKVVVTRCDEQGNIDIADLKEKADQYKDNLAALMVTYPSTHGVFEEGIIEINEIIHTRGGLVYMDGANMNAQVGLTSPGNINADVCHLNLHKTFAIPHGGGGPGMGPIGVAEHLVEFLPKHSLVNTGGKNGITAISAAPFGSGLILLISYAYIKMLGAQGVTDATKYAIFNANYIKARLDGAYQVLYTGAKGRVAHEMIIDCRDFKNRAGIEVEDIAKRLIDYGFHAPTVSFPVAGTIMVEPTESESKSELDRFCDAMLSIRKEIEDIANGTSDAEVNVLKMAPHTAEVVTADAWNMPYTRQQAAYPISYLKDFKFWPFVSRIDSAFGDRNLICSCPAIEEYETSESV
ncbi:MAG: aminomethyl-transferring glycine dehydrogenase [Luteibaculaceae bacterium]